MCKESSFHDGFGPRVSPPPLCAGADAMRSLCAMSSRRGLGSTGPRTRWHSRELALGKAASVELL